MERLVRVVAPHFVAGIVYDERYVWIRSAPILYWTKHKTIEQLREYCKQKQWRIQRVT